MSKKQSMAMYDAIKESYLLGLDDDLTDEIQSSAYHVLSGNLFMDQWEGPCEAPIIWLEY